MTIMNLDGAVSVEVYFSTENSGNLGKSEGQSGGSGQSSGNTSPSSEANPSPYTGDTSLPFVPAMLFIIGCGLIAVAYSKWFRKKS